MNTLALLSNVSFRNLFPSSPPSSPELDVKQIYERHSLPDAYTYIRLFRLDRQNPSSSGEISGTFVVRQYRNTDLVYHALSYTWGNPYAWSPLLDPASKLSRLRREWQQSQTMHTMRIDGTPFQIGQNLYDALHRVRAHQSLTHGLWIDALCINQDDADEKACQIAAMKDIYPFATKVLIWLGPQTAEVLPNRYMRRDPSIVNGARNCVLTSMSSWFSRLWAMQEALLADNVELLLPVESTHGSNLIFPGLMMEASLGGWLASFGFDTLEESSLMTDAFSLARIIFPLSHGLPFNFDESNYADRIRGLRLEALMYLFNSHLSTEPCDKVYALLGLASKSVQGQVKPDYSQISDRQDTTLGPDVVKKIMEASGSVDVLRYVEFGPPKPEHEPSLSTSGYLIPDGIAQKYFALPIGGCAYRSVEQPDFQWDLGNNLFGAQRSDRETDGRTYILRVATRFLDRIAIIGTCILTSQNRENISVMERIRPDTREIHAEKTSRVSRRVLIRFSFRSQETYCDKPPWASIQAADALSTRLLLRYPEAAVDPFFHSAKEPVLTVFTSMVQNVLRTSARTYNGTEDALCARDDFEAMNRRQVAASDQGVLLIIPEAARVGDSVVVFRGYEVPFVLPAYEPSPDKSVHRLIGACQAFGKPNFESAWKLADYELQQIHVY